MATTMQSNLLLLQQQNKRHDEDEDVALATILSNSLRFEQSQDIRTQPSYMYTQQKPVRRPRQRVTSGPQQIQKSTSTPNRRQQYPHTSSLHTSYTNDANRRQSASLPQDRRPSLTGSVTSNVSITSDMSINTKLSLTKRLRKVFSMSSLRSSSSSNELTCLTERNGSNTSINSVSTTATAKKRRSFSTLFQKSAVVEEPKKQRPELQVDTALKQPNPKVRSHPKAPDSPTSFTGLPPPRQSLPLPTPSFEDNKRKATLGLHFGSPRLRPSTTSSSSSLVTTKVQFSKTIQVHDTFASGDYDRRCDNNATCQKLTPMLAMKIKQELNEYKLTEMHVHVDSRQYTQFFL